MRIAVAGTNSLALLIAHYVVTETSHQIVVLARQAQPRLANQEYQVLIVDYGHQGSLQHAVMGVDTVISTVTGTPEVELLKACVSQRVRRFVPAEFEGRPSSRAQDDPLDQGKNTVLAWLEHYRSQIESTVFCCGVLYERFGPGGLAAHGLGLLTQRAQEGDYIVNVRTMRANAPVYDANHQLNVYICLTAAQDVARFVVRAIDMPRWPKEMTIAGERMTVWDMTNIVIRVRGVPLNNPIWHTPDSLRSDLLLAQTLRDGARIARAHDHIATVGGRYDFQAPGTMRTMSRCRDIVPLAFEAWLRSVWSTHPVSN
ncbi:NAD(P)-binding protein [Trichodelitschia bisporula]|uniref:NAD(P)-binding protein n=1 Tax=Trichodelitschia bisporula TaxID=703511 RepID=A0A6G1HP71_9PEZI|nr:NAD(P)-binding protein [Trichodelitschia bisporula]